MADRYVGGFVVDEAELRGCHYACDPSLCGSEVCCRRFDIEVSPVEAERILALRERLLERCPWLKDPSGAWVEVIERTPWLWLLKKRENGLCIFNVKDAQGRIWCALHAAALEAGENPFSWKPLGCSLWPFLRDGVDRLHLDRESGLPCVRNAPGAGVEENLLALLAGLPDTTWNDEV